MGGSAAYAAAMARSLGCQTRLVTAMGELPEELPGVEMSVLPSEDTTTFEYERVSGRRVQRITRRAVAIRARDIPMTWRSSSIWHLAPVADELDPDVVDAIPDSAFVGVTPQGWLRLVGTDGIVMKTSWAHPERVLRRANAVVLSREDMIEVYESAREWSSSGVIVAVTEGSLGSTVFVHGASHHLDAFPTDAVDEIGAGDVYAAAFFIRLAAGDGPLDAGRFASAAAACSLHTSGPACPPSRDEIAALLKNPTRTG